MAVQIENVLIIDTDVERIMRVRSAAKVESSFKTIAQVSSTALALERMQLQEFHLVFIAAELPQQSLPAFIEAARKIRGGRVASFVTVVSVESRQTELVNNVLNGADGVLIEPFSIDSFLEIVRISTSLLKERSTEMQKRLIDLALVDAITYVDSTATRLKTDKRLKSSSRALKRLADTLSNCHSVDEELYFEILIERFISMSTRKRQSKVYSGASERLRARLDKQYAAELLEEGPEKEK